jgi:hypothetical protein
LLLGAWMACYHFMYYDVLLTALPLTLLFTYPGQYVEQTCFLVIFWRRWLSPRRWGRRHLRRVLRAVVLISRDYLGLHLARRPQKRAADTYPPGALLLSERRLRIWLLHLMPPLWLAALMVIEHSLPKFGLGPDVGNEPWDTYCVMAVWLWCGLAWLWLPNPAATCEPALGYKKLVQPD